MRQVDRATLPGHLWLLLLFVNRARCFDVHMIDDLNFRRELTLLCWNQVRAVDAFRMAGAVQA